MLFGVVAFLFGNTQRGTELLVGWASFIVLKYIVGLFFPLIVRVVAPEEDTEKVK